MSDFRCLICEQSTATLELRRADLALHRCRTCGLVQLHPPPAVERCEDEYRDTQSYSDQLLPIEQAVLERDRAALERLLRRGAGGPLLDVGAGAGLLLEAALRLGLEASGLELSRPGAERIRRRLGATVLEVSLEDAPLPEGSLGIVTFSHSLEHLARPLTALRAAHRALRPGGMVHIAVPNYGSAKRFAAGGGTPWIFPGHVSYFTRRTLARALGAAGFEPVEGATRPFLGTDYRFVIALLRRCGLEPGILRFLKIPGQSLDLLLAGEVNLPCHPWKIHALAGFARAVMFLWPEALFCALGLGEELRVTAMRG